VYGIWDILWRVEARLRGLDFRYVPSGHSDAIAPYRIKDYADSGLTLRRFFDTIAPRWKPDPSDEAIDLECGKGGAVSVLARYFARADGIDISPELIKIGRNNLRKLRVQNARLRVRDASQFEDLDRYGFVYMFNPFPSEVMLSVVANINRSLLRKPRRMTVLYLKPLHIDLFEPARFQRLAEVYPCRSEYPFVLLVSPLQECGDVSRAAAPART